MNTKAPILLEPWAKDELVRLDDFVPEGSLLIGGLAVQYYIAGRPSHDLDLVLNYDEFKDVLRTAYPTDQYIIEERQTDLRPKTEIKRKGTSERIFLGPKILQREPYDFMNFQAMLNKAQPFKYGDHTSKNILVPAPHWLAYSKLLSFIDRRNDGSKGIRDLTDFTDLTNISSFSLDDFLSAIQEMGSAEHLQTNLLLDNLSETERNEISRSSISRAFSVLMRSDSPKQFTVGTASAQTNSDVGGILSRLNEILSFGFGEIADKFVAEIFSTQFSMGLVRLNWNIDISYDFSEIENGVVKEIISWEYELINYLSVPVQYELGLIHAKSNKSGNVMKMYKSDTDGRREEIELEDDVVVEGHYWKKQRAFLDLEPRKSYFNTLYYVNVWPVNSERPRIHNSLTSKQPCLNCRMRFNLPDGYSVSMIKRKIIEPNVIDNTYDVRFAEPLLAEQKIEYVVEINHEQ